MHEVGEKRTLLQEKVPKMDVQELHEGVWPMFGYITFIRLTFLAVLTT